MFFNQENLPFAKMEGLGNDYIYVNCLEYELSNPETIAKAVSDRHFGVGSDGLVLICKPSSEGADYRMRMFNNDGSEAESCGNALRCVGKYIYEKNISRKEILRIETKAGIVKLEFLLSGEEVSKIKVNMGEPILTAKKIPLNADSDSYINQAFSIPDFSCKVTCVSMGNPHAVFFVDKITDDLVLKIGPQIEVHPLFPNKTNVEFVEVMSKDRLKMRVWERGSGETLACGTGACGVLAAAVLNGLANRKITMELLGGELDLEWSELDNCIYQFGPAQWVCEGMFNISLIKNIS